MPTSSDTVFLSSYLLCITMLVVALPVYGWLRKKTPGSDWHRHGNVSTAPIEYIDLLGLALFLGLYALFLKEHLKPPKLDENGNPATLTLTLPFLLAQCVIQMVPPLLVAALFAFRPVSLVDFFGMRWKNARHLAVIAPAGVLAAYVFISGLEMLGFGTWIANHFGDDARLQQTVKIYQQTDSATIRATLAFSVIVVAPFAEELVFRGYIYTVTKRFSGRFFAALFSSLLFGVIHFNIMALVPLTFLAIVLAISYELTGSIWAPISIHTLFNATTIYFQEVTFH